jgi:putative CocE/NonD family hydrolase
MKKRFAVIAGLAAASAGIYVYRWAILARLLGLPAPRYRARVERDIPVEMPDGARLYADHYWPAGMRARAAEAGVGAGSAAMGARAAKGGMEALSAGGDSGLPTILIRTPYGRGKEVAMGGGLGLGELAGQTLAQQGYHVVVQGVRGCYDSEGEFEPHVNEAADGEATVEWIARQPWFSGTLGTWGASYLGYTQWATADRAPDALQAMVIMITSAENHSVSFPDGAFGLETRLRWSQGMHMQKRLHGRPLREHLASRLSGSNDEQLRAAFDHLPLAEADVVAAGEPVPFFREIVAHPSAEDAYWTARDHRTAPGRVGAAIQFVGGWYDYYLRGLLRDYAQARESARRAGRQEPYLTIGPWAHSTPAGIMAGLREGAAWFDAHLKGVRSRLRSKPVRLYVMGADEWRDMDAFPPPAREARYYLQRGAGLAERLPQGTQPADHYRYDPADPTPAVGGALLAFQGAGAQDNGPLEARPDVLCYTTEPLARPVEVIGPVRLELYVRSSLAHTDFFGRLCDVDTAGRSTNVCDGLFRIEPGRGEPQPDGSLQLEIDLWATAHRFHPGHRLRLQVSSGAHPHWSRNLGTGEPLGSGTEMTVAEQTVYHDTEHPSALVLPVVG